MNINKIFFVSLIISLIFSVCMYAGPISKSKLSPLTCKLIHDYKTGNLNKDKTFIMNVKPTYFLKTIQNRTFASGMIKVNDNISLEDLNSLGIQIGTKAGSIWTLNVPMENIESLSKITGIDYIQIDEPVKIKLDSAVKTTRVDLVHQGLELSQPYKGKGVIVGIVDGGFDYTNPVFNDANGNSRIKRVWDQNAIGTPPQGFIYGKELTEQSDMESDRTDDDAESHGTHVANIAGGNGEISDGKYIGMAPECEFVFVSSKNSSSDSSPFSTGQSEIVDGINYIFNYAESVGKPAVVNLSLGYHGGPHDGTSLFDQACDALVGPGKIIVGAGGNEGNYNVHIGYEFNPNDTIVKTIIGFFIYGGVDLWGEEGENFCFQVLLYDHNNMRFIDSSSFYCSSEVTNDSLVLKGTMNEDWTFYYYTNPSEFNNKPRISFYIQSYNFTVDPVLVVKGTSGKINFWNIGDMWFDSFGFPGFTDGDNNCSVGEIGGTGKNIITTGAYTSKHSWYSFDGDINFTDDNYSDIAGFSSMGPTVDGRTKPDISAPGSAVVSAINSNDMNFFPQGYEWDYVTDRFYKNSKYWSYAAFEGTSMSTPCVVGIVAILLQEKSDLTPSQVKDILKTTAIKDIYTGNISAEGSNIWGWGKVNVWDATKEVIKLDVKDEDFSHKNFIYPNPNNGKFYFHTDNIQKQNLKFEIYDYLGNNYTPLNIVKINDNLYNIDISNLPLGVYFIYLSGCFNSYQQIVKIK